MLKSENEAKLIPAKGLSINNFNAKYYKYWVVKGLWVVKIAGLI
jgi:hypothetical protein